MAFTRKVLSMLIVMPALAFPYTRVQPFARPYSRLAAPRRTRQLIVENNASLTIGDVLSSVADRQLSKLSPREQLERDERTLDAMLAAGSAELDAVSKDLDRELERAATNASAVLGAGMRLAERQFDATFNATVYRLDCALSQSREEVRSALEQHRLEQAAAQLAEEQQRANQRGYASTRHALSRRESGLPLARKHPVVIACDTSAAVLSLMLFFLIADVASPQHLLTTPPRITSPRLSLPVRQ